MGKALLLGVLIVTVLVVVGVVLAVYFQLLPNPFAPAAGTISVVTGIATIDSFNVAVSWSSATNASTYNVSYAIVPLSTTSSSRATLTSASTKVKGLSTQVTLTATGFYYFFVQPTNGKVGTFSATPIFVGLIPPSGGKLVSAGSSIVTVEWNKDPIASGYNLYAATPSGSGNWMRAATAVQWSSTGQPATGLTPESSYDIAVTSLDTSGFETARSVAVTGITTASPPPLNFVVEPGLDSSSLVLTWAVNPASHLTGSYVVKYRLTSATTSNGPWAVWPFTSTAATTTTSITNLQIKLYDVEIAAVGAGGNLGDFVFSGSNQVGAPPPPTQLRNESFFNSSCQSFGQFTWSSVANAVSYELDWNPNGTGEWTTIYQGPATSWTSAAGGALGNCGTPQEFRVVVSNSVGSNTLLLNNSSYSCGNC
jgi:hypothetical protein